MTLPVARLTAAGSSSIVKVSSYATLEPEALFPTHGVFRAGLAAFTKVAELIAFLASDKSAHITDDGVTRSVQRLCRHQHTG